MIKREVVNQHIPVVKLTDFKIHFVSGTRNYVQRGRNVLCVDQVIDSVEESRACIEIRITCTAVITVTYLYVRTAAVARDIKTEVCHRLSAFIAEVVRSVPNAPGKRRTVNVVCFAFGVIGSELVTERSGSFIGVAFVIPIIHSAAPTHLVPMGSGVEILKIVGEGDGRK